MVIFRLKVTRAHRDLRLSILDDQAGVIYAISLFWMKLCLMKVLPNNSKRQSGAACDFSVRS